MANDTSVKKTLTTVDRSTKALTTSAEAIAKAAAELQSVVATANALAQDIEFKQSELSGLESAYAIKERELVAELSLKVKENSENVLNALLKERKLVGVGVDVIPALEKQIQVLTNETTNAVDAAVKAETAKLTAAAVAQLAAKESAHQVEIATLKANNSSLTERIGFLTAQIAQLQNEIQQERNARIQIAQADAAKQGVVVNAGK